MLGSALRLRVAAVLVAAAAFVPLPGAGQASPWVPTLDPAYADLDVLVSRGLVRSVILGQRPYSRMAFARAAAEAREALAGSEHGGRARIREAVERLETQFARERGLLCPAGTDACPRAEAYTALRGVSAQATLADSPPRPVPTPHTSQSNIDADVNPLLLGKQGRVLADGWTVGTEGILDLVLGNGVAAQIQPRAWLAEGMDGTAEADVTLLRGYVRGLVGNLSVEVGRNHLLQGSARAYGPVLSQTPRGFDLLRLSMEEPRRLPWVFRHLGPAGFAFWVADMGGGREFPHSKLFTYQGSIRPHPNLELGGALLNHQMGEGGPEATWTQRVRDLFFLDRRRFLPVSALPAISDKALAADVRLTLPALGTDLYVEVMTTDDHNLFSSLETGLGTEAVWTAGFRVSGLGGDGRWDLWGEGGRNGVRPYTHHQYTSGMTLDRRILGSPLGPVANGVTLGVDWTGSGARVSWSGAAERYQGDRYRDDPSPGTDWIKIEDNPDEIRLRTTLDWTRQPAVTGLVTTVRLGYERVTRFDYTDQDRTNFLVQVGVGYVW